jgi:hypothetical protein
VTSLPTLHSTLTKEKNRPVPPGSKPSLIPFVTAREGEDPAPDNLLMLPDQYGARRLFYADEDPRDRPLPGVLWARCSFNPADKHQMPTGRPQWKLMHPYRQMLTMRALYCQVCARPAQTPLGYCFFLPQPPAPDQAMVLTNQPPVCAKHLRAAVELCPHVEPVVYLAESAPLYGVLGTLYGIVNKEVTVIAQPDHPLPFKHPQMPAVLASLLVCRLTSFRVVALDELLRELATLGA